MPYVPVYSCKSTLPPRNLAEWIPISHVSQILNIDPRTVRRFFRHYPRSYWVTGKRTVRINPKWVLILGLCKARRDLATARLSPEARTRLSSQIQAVPEAVYRQFCLDLMRNSSTQPLQILTDSIALRRTRSRLAIPNWNSSQPKPRSKSNPSC